MAVVSRKQYDERYVEKINDRLKAVHSLYELNVNLEVNKKKIVTEMQSSTCDQINLENIECCQTQEDDQKAHLHTCDKKDI